MALPFLQAAEHSEKALFELCEALIAEIVTVLFCTGCATLGDLRQDGIIQ
jgi:isopentenyl-diphosphate delta-isomerase